VITYILEILSYLLLSATKFSVAAAVLLALDYMNYTKTALILFVGGSVGTLVFYYFGTIISTYLDKLLNKKNSKPKKTFSRKNRLIIKVKSSYGLIGLALLTPIIFSIPIGSLLAARFFSRNKYVLHYLLGSVIFWSLLLPVLPVLYNGAKLLF